MNRYWLFLIMTAVLGIGLLAGYGVAYLQDVQVLIPGPSAGRLPYLALQVPPLWYAYATAAAALAGALIWTVGTMVGRRRERVFGPQRLRADTRLRLRWMNGRIQELEGQMEERIAERDAVIQHWHEARRKLAVISRTLTSTPHDELAEQRLLQAPRRTG